MHRDLGPMNWKETLFGFLYWPVFLLGSELLVLLVPYLFGLRIGENIPSLWIILLRHLLNFTLVTLIFRRFLAEHFRRLRASRKGRTVGTIAIGYAIIRLGTAAVSILIQLLSMLLRIDYVNENQQAVFDVIRGSAVLGFLIIVFLAPVVEECLNRGLIFGLIRRRSRVWAYVVSILVFSSVHVIASAFTQPVIVSVFSLLTYIPASFALAWVYERTETIWASIALHLLNNLASFLMILLLMLLEPLIGDVPLF